AHRCITWKTCESISGLQFDLSFQPAGDMYVVSNCRVELVHVLHTERLNCIDADYRAGWTSNVNKVKIHFVLQYAPQVRVERLKFGSKMNVNILVPVRRTALILK